MKLYETNTLEGGSARVRVDMRDGNPCAFITIPHFTDDILVIPGHPVEIACAPTQPNQPVTMTIYRLFDGGDR